MNAVRGAGRADRGNPASLDAQYATDANLAARIALHRNFSVNAQGWYRWLDGQLAIPATASILDIGCGDGSFWEHHAGDVARLILADRSPGMVRSAAKRLAGSAGRPVFVAADATALPFAGASVDAVIANHMLYHVTDRPRALREIRRVLRPGGWLFAATNGRAHMRELTDLLARHTGQAGREQPCAPFCLENGAAQLAPWFDQVRLERYADSLRVTETGPLIAYIRSMGPPEAYSLAAIDALRQDVDATIAREGALRIAKASGLFVARRAGLPAQEERPGRTSPAS